MYLVAFLCVVFACLRFTLTFPPIDFSVSTVYKDLAHLFVGGLFGAAIAIVAIERLILGYAKRLENLGMSKEANALLGTA